MGIKFQNYIANFDAGMTTKKRDQTPGIARVVKHFDNYTESGKLTPYRSMKLDAVAGTESGLNNYQITKMVNTSVGIYGLGTMVGTSHPQIYVKSVTPTDPTQVWTTAASGSDNSGSTVKQMFVLYHNILYFDMTTSVGSYDLSGPTYSPSAYTAHIPSGQGIVHSKDDIMYFPSNNLIIKNDNGSFSVALTLPSNSTIADICEYNDYVGILVNQPNGSVVAYIWDRNTSLTTLSSKVDFGVGLGVLIENLGGILSIIMTTSINGSASLVPKIAFKYWTGVEVKIFEEYICDYFPVIPNCKQTFNNLFYFLADISVNGVVCKGVWKIVKRTNGNLVVSFDRLPRNDTPLTTGSVLKAFLRIGDYMFVSYTIPVTGLHTIWRTDDSPNYTATSIFETTKFNHILGLRNKHIPDSSMVKKIVGVTLTTEPLTSGQSAGINYRIEGETSWTTIFTMSTVGVITHSAVNREGVTPKANLREYKEGEFQLFSTGGAEITGFEFTAEIIGKRKY